MTIQRYLRLEKDYLRKELAAIFVYSRPAKVSLEPSVSLPSPNF